ncbi:MAG: hypothetical protein Kow00133_17850 [Amphiplicatus sp.]
MTGRIWAGRLTGVLLCFAQCAGCAAEEAATQAEDEMEPAIGGSLLIYERGVSGELPEQALLKDGSCWDLTKVATPWTVVRVTESSFTLEAPSDALGVPHLDLDTEVQQIVRISLGYNPNYERHWVSPQKLQDNLEKGFAVEYPKYSRPPFKALQAGDDSPSDKFGTTNLVDFERNIVCRLDPVELQVSEPNPGIRCARYDNGRVYTYRFPAAALDQLDARIDEFTSVLNNLACAEGE